MPQARWGVRFSGKPAIQNVGSPTEQEGVNDERQSGNFVAAAKTNPDQVERQTKSERRESVGNYASHRRSPTKHCSAQILTTQIAIRQLELS
jgi:hypothetical protein